MSEPIYRLSDIPFVADARVNASLSQCLYCGHTIEPEATNATDDVMLLFARCYGCKRVYVLDSMTLQQ